MSASITVLLNTEFWLLWSVRQLLRGFAIGVGLASGMLTLSLFSLVGELGSLLEMLQERHRATALSRNTTQLATAPRGDKEILS